ncbi:SH3 domain-containing protein [Synechococcus sp. CB0101]|nr:SH3 domain-containing protein [Synechococcus sp. CB0101]
MGCSITASAESRLGAWRWGAVLAFALFAPVALPAGGADRRQPEVRRRTTGEPLLSTSSHALQAAPDQQAPSLAQIHADQPLRVVRSWREHGGEQWVQVHAGDRRGWLAVA